MVDRKQVTTLEGHFIPEINLNAKQSVKAVGRSADVVGPARHRDFRAAAKTGVVTPREAADVVNADGRGDQFVLVGDQRGDPRCPITGGDGAPVCTAPPRWYQGSDRDGHLRGAGW